MTPPIRPGPAVAAIASTSASVTPASASAPSTSGDQRLDMGARGDLGHDAAIGPVRRLLAGEPVREDPAVAGHQRRRGFVAAEFEAEDQRSSRSSSSRDRRASASPPWPDPLLRLGTRGSPLALVQAHMVRDALCAAHGWAEDAVEIVPIRTTGDQVQDRALAEIGGKALWTKELDRALLDGEIDCAVHSMKDVETIRPDGDRDRRDAAARRCARPADRRGEHRRAAAKAR